MNSYAQLIKDLGANLTLTKRLTATYNTLTGSLTTTTKNYTVRGYIFSGEDSSRVGDGFTESFVKALLSNKQTNGLTLPDPIAGDLVVSNDTTYEILAVTSTSEKDTKLFYTCDLKG
jgi:hypothetical protein